MPGIILAFLKGKSDSGIGREKAQKNKKGRIAAKKSRMKGPTTGRVLIRDCSLCRPYFASLAPFCGTYNPI
jgi:hypothetical protein